MGIKEDFAPSVQSEKQDEAPYQVWRQCACHSCCLQKQFAEDGWLCDFHEVSHPDYWTEVSKAIKRWLPLIMIAYRLERELAYEYTLHDEWEDRLTQKLTEMNVPFLAPRKDLDGFNRDGHRISRREAPTEIARRIRGYVLTKIVPSERMQGKGKTIQQVDSFQKLAAGLRM